VVLIFLVLAFYRLFKDVDQRLAALLVIVGGVMPALINSVNVVSDAGALMGRSERGAAGGADFCRSFDKPQRDAHWSCCSSAASPADRLPRGDPVGGSGSSPLGALVYKSRFLPRFIGVWLIINGVGLSGSEPHGLFFPDYQDKVFASPTPPCSDWRSSLWLVSRALKPPGLGTSDDTA